MSSGEEHSRQKESLTKHGVGDGRMAEVCSKNLKEAVVKGGGQAGVKRTRGQTRGGSGVCVGQIM